MREFCLTPKWNRCQSTPCPQPHSDSVVRSSHYSTPCVICFQENFLNFFYPQTLAKTQITKIFLPATTSNRAIQLSHLASSTPHASVIHPSNIGFAALQRQLCVKNGWRLHSSSRSYPFLLSSLRQFRHQHRTQLDENHSQELER